MKTLCLFVLFYFFIHCSFCQVSGQLKLVNGQPVPNVDIRMLKIADSSFFRSAITDADGLFKIELVDTGSYILRFSVLGYQTWTSTKFVITNNLKVKNFGAIIISESITQLVEVTIKAAKPLVQQETGGLIVNVQSSLLTKGSTALQVLQRSPGVVIDPRDNTIILNGKSGVMVMLDGRLMRMPMAQVTAFLNSMSADNISKIELLTTPPSKYDADGNAGLINIVTKKNKTAGTNGSATLTTGYGRTEKGSAAINLNHTAGKINVYGGYTFSHDRNYGELFAEGTENVPAIGGQTYFNYLGIGKPVSNYHNANAGIDYKINKTLTVGSSINYAKRIYHNRSHNSGYYAMRSDSVLLVNSYLDGTTNSQNLSGNVYIEKEMTKGEKINFNYDYIYNDNSGPTNVQSSFIDKHGNQAGKADSLYSPIQRDLANTTVRVGVAKFDYSKQFSTRLKIEAGAKGTYTRSLSVSGIENQVNGKWVSNITASNNLATTETIGAVYTTINMQIDSATSLVAGGRFEYSHNRTDKPTLAIAAINRRLGAFFPGIFLTRKLENGNQWQLSYTKRITRPSYNDLASYITYNDPISVFTGYPALKPTITQNLKISYYYQDFLFSLLLSRDDDPIANSQITTGPLKSIVYLSPRNMTYRDNLDFQTNLPFKLSSWWDMNFSFEGGLRQYRLDYTLVPVVKTFFAWSANFSEKFRLPDSFQIEISGNYISPSFYATSKSNQTVILNLGIKKDLKNNRGSLLLTVADLLRGASYNSYIGGFTQDAFATNVHVRYNAESIVFPIIKVSYYRSIGNNGAKKQDKHGNVSKEERDRI